MVETARRALIEKCENSYVTLEGHRAVVGGWRISDCAGISAGFAGSYLIRWEVLERVIILENGEIMGKHLSDGSFRGLWKEHLETIPISIRKKFGDYFTPDISTLPTEKQVSKLDADRAKLAKWIRASQGRI